jgi:hypothetical protein
MAETVMPAIGDEVAYRSIAGETWDAKIVDVRRLLGSILVDVDVFLPDNPNPTTSLKGVSWHDDPSEEMPGARPKKRQ